MIDSSADSSKTNPYNLLNLLTKKKREKERRFFRYRALAL